MSGVLESAPQQGAVRSVTESGMMAANMLNAEEGLALRHRAKPCLRREFTCEFTREPDLIHQYFRIYQSECRIIPEFLKDEEEYNSKSSILVVRRGNLVVGGARLFLKTPRLQKKFLLELAGFDLNSHFPDLDAKQMRYAELCRLVLLPDYRRTDILKDMLFQIGRKCVAMNLDVFFAAAPMTNVRLYKLICNGFGYNEARIHYDIDIPPDPGFEEIRDYLFSVWRDRRNDQFFLAGAPEDRNNVEKFECVN